MPSTALLRQVSAPSMARAARSRHRRNYPPRRS